METNKNNVTRESRPLDERGIVAGTDKSSLANDYLRHYERIFAPWRERSFTVFEIGVAQGASLLLWRDYFPNAEIVGIDINPQCKRFEGPRIRVLIGSQDDPEFLLGLCAGARPGIIIDDGSHRADHIQFTFERLFPHLLPGGLYVIEDLYLHFGDAARNYRGTAATSIPDTIALLMSQLMCGRVSGEEGSGFAAYLSRTIDRVEIISKAAVIGKKEPPPPVDLEAMFRLVEHSPDSDNWHHLSTWIMHGNGPLERAVDATRRAVAANPRHPGYRSRLADLLHRTGKLEEAISEAEEAVRLANPPAEDPIRGFLESLRAKAAERGGQRT
jgi:hypothetical protein